VLRLEDRRLVAIDRGSHKTLRTIAYDRVANSTYAEARRPVWKTKSDACGFTRGLAKAVNFSARRSKRWLTEAAAAAQCGPEMSQSYDVDRLLSMQTQEVLVGCPPRQLFNDAQWIGI
jgi:hypothetical protein